MEPNPTKTLMDTLLHPVRMRILLALSGNSGMTAQQIAEKLTDVPQATLYRHIARLQRDGFLRVSEERRVRGTVEKVYTLGDAQTASVDAEALAAISKEDHLRYFTAFTMNLVDEFSRYLNATPSVDFARDGVGYTQMALAMTDAELAQFAGDVNAALLPYASLEETPERRKRIFTTVMVPGI